MMATEGGGEYGQPVKGVLIVQQGAFRSNRQQYCELNPDHKFIICKSADPSSAILHTIQLKNILSAGTAYEEDEKPLFVVCTADKSFSFIAPDKSTMTKWILSLNPPSKGGTETGWLVINKKKRYCELRKTAIVMFKEKDDKDPCGAIALDSMCTVIPPQNATPPTGIRRMTTKGVSFSINTAGQLWIIGCKTVTEANRWVAAIQDTIECCPELTTRFDKLATAHQNSDAFTLDEVFLDRAILCYSDEPIDSPLTPVPYGKVGKVPSGNEYGHPYMEALDIFRSMIPGHSGKFGSVLDGEPWILRILQIYVDVAALRNEIFCQSLKQVIRIPSIHTRYAIRHWQLLAALCAHFKPSSKYFNFVRSCLHHAAQHQDHDEIIRQCANYCLEMLQKPSPLPAISNDLMTEIMSGQGFANIEASKMVLSRVIEPDCDA